MRDVSSPRKSTMLEQRLVELREEYDAANHELSYTRDEVDRLRLQRRIRILEKEIEAIETTLGDGGIEKSKGSALRNSRPAETGHAYFSYDSLDQEFAVRAARDLRSEGFRVWITQLDLVAGDDRDRAIEEALYEASTVLVVLSPSAVASKHVRNEISFAAERSISVIPLLYKDCVLPLKLHSVQYIDFRNDYQTPLARLMATLVAPVRRSPHIRSMTDQIQFAGFWSTTVILSKQPIAVQDAVGRVAEGFGLDAKDEVIHIQRLRKSNGVPISIQTVYLRSDYCPGILDEELDSLLQLYSEKYRCTLVKADERLRLSYPSTGEAKLLQLQEDQPVVIRDRVSFDQNSRPFEVLHSVDRMDKFEYTTSLEDDLRSQGAVNLAISL